MSSIKDIVVGGAYLILFSMVCSTSLGIAVCIKYDKWYDRCEAAKWGDSTSSFGVRLRFWYRLLKAQMREVNFSFIAVMEMLVFWIFFFP